MKILYDYTAFLTQARGGVTRVFNEVIKREMVREGVECNVYAGLHKNYEMHEIAQQFPGKVHEWFLPEAIAKQRLFMPINQALFVPFARRFAPDICHYTLFQTPRVPAKTKTVITVHDLIGEIYLQRETNPQVKERELALPKVDGLICVSERTKEDLVRYYDVGDKPIIVAYHGNSIRSSAVTAPDIKVPYFLYVSMRGEGHKNFGVLLEAFGRLEMLKPYALVCFGGGPFTSRETEKINKLKLADRVFQHSGPDDVLAGYYKNATALVYPSRYEGFGLPPIEAMAFGCPVLASQAPPMPEINRDAALYFDPESVDQLLEAIRMLLSEKGVRESLIQKGREREQFFCWEKTALQIHNFYCHLLGT